MSSQKPLPIAPIKKPPRDEFKYLITWEQREFLMELWKPRIEKDSYSDQFGKTPVLSLYYDSPQLDFYYEKLDGIHTRNKIRLRVYDFDYKIGVPAFLEIKQRFGDKIRKVRTYVNQFSEDLLELENWKFETPLERDSFETLFARYRPVPTAQVFYIREPYVALEEKDLRLTFDSSLIGLFPTEKLNHQILNDPLRSLMPEDLCILEVKTNAPTLPKWVHFAIKRLGLVQRPIPKYISAIEKLAIANTRMNIEEYG